MSGIDLIAQERQRQIEQERWTAEHDDHHDFDQIPRAAAWYALPDWMRERIDLYPVQVWPWDAKYWKPTPDDRIRELVKAGALIAAEIDRLQRTQEKDITP